jgi:hypothetical protein
MRSCRRERPRSTVRRDSRITQRCGNRRCGVDRHRRDPVIPEAGHRAQQCLAFRVVADRAAYREDGLAEHRVADAGPAPDRGDEFIATDRAIAVFDEVGHAIEHGRRQFDALVRAPQLARGDIQRAVAETESLPNHTPRLAAAAVQRKRRWPRRRRS